MKLLKVDTLLVSRPKVMVSVTPRYEIDHIASKMAKTFTQYHVTVVSGEGGFVAVDNIEVLDAARIAKIPRINAVHLGRKDPVLTHLQLSISKPMANPMRAKMALRHISPKAQELRMNPYLERVLETEFDSATELLLAELIDSIFEMGIRIGPPLSFFTSLSKLDGDVQRQAIVKTRYLCEELKQKYFTWPDMHLFKLLLGVKKPKPKTRGSVSKGTPSFDCIKCGTSYGVINDQICRFEEEDGCLVVRDRFGNAAHSVPPKYAKFLGALTRDDALHFSKHEDVAELEDLKIDGPFLLVRLDKKPVQ